MGVDRLPNGPNQPFYNVLVEDGTNRYAAEGLSDHMTREKKSQPLLSIILSFLCPLILVSRVHRLLSHT